MAHYLYLSALCHNELEKLSIYVTTLDGDVIRKFFFSFPAANDQNHDRFAEIDQVLTNDRIFKNIKCIFVCEDNKAFRKIPYVRNFMNIEIVWPRKHLILSLPFNKNATYNEARMWKCCNMGKFNCNPSWDDVYGLCRIIAVLYKKGYCPITKTFYPSKRINFSISVTEEQNEINIYEAKLSNYNKFIYESKRNVYPLLDVFKFFQYVLLNMVFPKKYSFNEYPPSLKVQPQYNANYLRQEIEALEHSLKDMEPIDHSETNGLKFLTNIDIFKPLTG